MNKDICFLGAGSFGTALSIILAEKGKRVILWDRNHDLINSINSTRENKKYVKGVRLPQSIEASFDLKNTVQNCMYIVLAIPSHVIRDMCKNIRYYLRNDQIIISIAKGIEEETGKRLSEVIKEELPENEVVVISGPSHAEEVANKLPTTVVVSSENMDIARNVQDVFMTDKFRVYTNSDIRGIEIGGAVKNIIALAAGISDGIGYGDNTKAALMTRGISEISRIGVKLGGKKETFSGLTGIGDLIVTCTSMHSRNRRAGILIGKGKSAKEAVEEVGMVVEGIKACRAFYKLKNKLNVQMPITDSLYKVLFEKKDAKQVVYELMTRDKKDEN
ncbi:NAD(P)H-dependent glycerol-3-phosphate dehydrogenase [Clostridium tyrobutyricum]|jgi:glycerol-3-phosphate dehydrogenase (NAD(P)+)|uniref:Glycerol-3-phosphate dehydrogenase [NAD(P)+] n=1 Tax=Clostridium tyrobutyricum DIVETGP TaxID=1408889 RepID=W6N2Q8_CLOTY|nr:NAD(P)H-dependent glycerol-3-phosphate dehydrogenase [Clostridium tyrobutyricum]AND85106.1 glycerol-3-phosphate dehydrogenase [NAD(P)+] [Clostridium tyrobutyricum]ANP69664.1 glycerol-3-phosphate dehydrogenase [Clostridium tyrobutyricum]MBR9647002.1 NAD(P)H-dependent glycerol-3-phosphate dehydrogenase [Clostridium tyrobutyricum]MBV4414934.1 NAD(P)H-dependent glycerol-3-phosphate dehydrogenase [Clostridium tyrobutyricum]MBV4420794.1 NAD(P)H-dependent glycerol-3-phosphate dehydrogenase [Clostr